MAENKQRIDMGHGFMQHIIRNQIDRDNYDKEIKAKKQDVKQKPKSQGNKIKKPALKAYIPPQRLNTTSAQVPDVIMFTIEYKHKDGKIFKIDIYKDDIPEKIAKVIGNKFDLPPVFEQALAQRVHQEMEKRVDV